MKLPILVIFLFLLGFQAQAVERDFIPSFKSRVDANQFEKILPKKGWVNFRQKNVRLLMESGYEIDFDLGRYNKKLQLKGTHIMIGDHSLESDNYVSAREENIPPPSVESFDYVLISDDLTELKFSQIHSIGKEPVRLTIKLHVPFDGQDFSPQKIKYIELYSGDAPWKDDANRPIATRSTRFTALPSYEQVYFVLWGNEAQQLYDAVKVTVKYDGPLLSMVEDTPNLSNSIIYRKHLMVSHHRQGIYSALFFTERPLEARWVLSGLRALGIKDHTLIESYEGYNVADTDK